MAKQSADAATSAADTARRSLDSSSETSQQTLREFEQFIAPALAKSPMYSDFSNKGADVQIQAHERVRQYISGRKITTAEFAAIRSGTSKLWIYGEITYTDSISGKHKIGFCERYDPRMNDFFRERVAGFNYGD